MIAATRGGVRVVRIVNGYCRVNRDIAVIFEENGVFCKNKLTEKCVVSNYSCRHYCTGTLSRRRRPRSVKISKWTIAGPSKVTVVSVLVNCSRNLGCR